MPELKRVRVGWSGWAGGPGVSTFLFESAGAPPLVDLRTMYAAWAPIIPTGITLQIENTGQTIASETGQAVGAWSAGAQTAIACTGAGGYAAPAGCYVSWRTGVFLGGREIRGKTFIVPLVAGAYDGTGTILDQNRQAVENAAKAFIATGGSTMRIYNRSQFGFGGVTSATVPDKVVVLTSRRA